MKNKNRIVLSIYIIMFCMLSAQANPINVPEKPQYEITIEGKKYSYNSKSDLKNFILLKINEYNQLIDRYKKLSDDPDNKLGKPRAQENAQKYILKRDELEKSKFDITEHSVTCYSCNGMGTIPGLIWGVKPCTRCNQRGKILVNARKHFVLYLLSNDYSRQYPSFEAARGTMGEMRERNMGDEEIVEYLITRLNRDREK